MSLETKVVLRRYADGVELPSVSDSFVRRDFDAWDERDLELGASLTEIKTHLTSIELLYIKRTGAAATISVYKNMSPESWDFDNTFMVFVAGSLTSLSLKADTDTVVHLYMAGS